MHDPRARRAFLEELASASTLLALVGCSRGAASGAEPASSAKKGGDEAEVTPGEDLMQEHGLVERVLLVYDEAARRIDARAPLDLVQLTDSAGIVRRFVQDYHEKLEEEFVFPRLETAKLELELVGTLRRQHQRGRELTDQIVALAGRSPSPELVRVLRSFTRMYRPHAAREDTVLFPAFRKVVGRSAYEELGEHFEDEERRRLGPHGFETTVAQIGRIEAALGIGDLQSFTP